MPLPKRKLVPTILLALVLAALAAPPLWWSTSNPPVIDPTAAENNHGPANIGQAKHMAKSAIEALRPILPAVASQIEADLVPIVDLTIPDPKPAGWAFRQKAPLLIGQLKAIADPFYSHLHTAAPAWLEAERITNQTNHPNSIFPWTTETTDDQNKAIATIGQLKAVFSLRFDTLVPPFDPLEDPDGDPDGDGIPTRIELQLGLNPLLADSDGNGILDGDEDSNGDAFRNKDEIAWNASAADPGSIPLVTVTDQYYFLTEKANVLAAHNLSQTVKFIETAFNPDGSENWTTNIVLGRSTSGFDLTAGSSGSGLSGSGWSFWPSHISEEFPEATWELNYEDTVVIAPVAPIRDVHREYHFVRIDHAGDYYPISVQATKEPKSQASQK